MVDTPSHPNASASDTIYFGGRQTLDHQRIAGVSRVTWVGVFTNIGLALLKGIAGVWAGANALVADAIHSASDIAADCVVLVGVKYWCAPADACHPHGHRKIETLITFGIGVALAAAAIGMGCHAVGEFVTHLSGEGDHHVVVLNTATVLAFCVAMLSLASNETLYRWTVAKGKKLQSSAVIANAWHHRSDAFSSIPPALSIGGGAVGAWFGYNPWFLDPVGTLVVCVMLLQAAWEVIGPTMKALLDASVDRALCSAIRETVLSTPGVLDTHKIRTRCIGPKAASVDLHVLVPGDLSVAQGHDIAGAVKRRILALDVEDGYYKPTDVIVHIEPVKTLEHALNRGRESDTMVDWMAKK
jgi:cation diffusion facilitator family transporter